MLGSRPPFTGSTRWRGWRRGRGGARIGGRLRLHRLPARGVVWRSWRCELWAAQVLGCGISSLGLRQTVVWVD